MAMNLISPNLWNKTILGSQNPEPGPPGERLGRGGGISPRGEAPLGAKGLAWGGTGGVAPAAPPGGFTVQTPNPAATRGANLVGAPAAPATVPDFTPTRTSLGGSMVLGKDNLGVEEIRGTGHPSWQVYHGAGMGEAYPGAVAGWRSGLAREAGEAEKEKSSAAAQVEAATIGATKEGPGATLVHKAQAAGLTEETKRKTIQDNQDIIQKRFEEETGTQDPITRNFSLSKDPAVMALHQKVNRLVMQGVDPEEAYKTVAPELHKHYYTPENAYRAIQMMEEQKGSPLSDVMKQKLLSGSPEAMETMFPYVVAASRSQRGGVAKWLSPAPALGANLAPSAPVQGQESFVSP